MFVSGAAAPVSATMRCLSHDLPDELFGRRDALVGAVVNLPTPLWVVDRQGRTVLANAAAEELFGRCVGLHFTRFFAADSVNVERERFARELLGPLMPSIHESALLVWGRRVTVELMVSPLRTADEAVGMLFVARTLAEPPGVAAGRKPVPRLTPRQHQVLELLADGAATATIAGHLGISENTARNHIRLLLQELRVHTRLEAVVAAFRNGWL
jgi:PAS domain S-box-containing protein